MITDTQDLQNFFATLGYTKEELFERFIKEEKGKVLELKRS